MFHAMRHPLIALLGEAGTLWLTRNFRRRLLDLEDFILDRRA